jgi:hypothetical protein
MEIKSLFNCKTALKRMASPLLVGVAAVAFQGVAYAHYPVIVSATASCSNGAAVINYTVGSWQTGTLAGSNNAIEVLFNGSPVDSEALNPPSDQFSGTMPAPLFVSTVVVDAYAADAWDDGYAGGESSDDPTTVTIPTNCSTGIGRFTGGGKDVGADGVTITKGFEVDCDLKQPSNNLEINWTGGNHFHMENFYSAVCTLQGNPNPPKAPVNTIVGMGTGRYDGVEGYTVVFELQDNGEPGTNDKTSFLIYETANPSNVVLNLPLSVITSGNIQAHVDQR